MFQRLLVPLDGTPQAAAALPLARTVARACGASISLLRVVPTSLLVPTPLLGPAPDDPRHRQAVAYLDRVAAELREASIVVDLAVREGDAAAEILAEAQAQQADLIVMATHGRGGVTRALLGSTTESVLARSPLPVLLLRPGGRRVAHMRSFVVAVDGSPGSLVALTTAVSLARATRARIVLLRVAVPLPLWIYEPTAGIDTSAWINPAWNEDLRMSAETYVDALAGRLRRAGLEAEGAAVLGLVPQAIVRTADELAADLIVMSTHARTGPARLALGSVADAVVRTARRPVLLVRCTPKDGRARGRRQGLRGAGTRRPVRDIVTEQSEQSFPASDVPSWIPAATTPSVLPRRL